MGARAEKLMIIEHDEDEIDDEERNEDVVFDNDKFMESVYEHFVFDNKSILNGKYLRLYLKEILNINMNGCEDEEGVLRNVLIELFGDEVVNNWGYHIRCKRIDFVD